ncbi:MAG TPA: hypothetical protein VFE37_30075 [Chloroflexota bacterium]|nr:hypothetical protein [Chloroflexota bacterium]
MHDLKLSAEQVTAVRCTLQAPGAGAGVAWCDEQVRDFSIRLELAVEHALRAAHPYASDAEISFATAAYWADMLDEVCELRTARVGHPQRR